MLLPIGLDAGPIRRLPVVTIAIAAVCVAVFVATPRPVEEAAFRSGERAVLEFWKAHPYVAVPAEMERTLQLTPRQLQRLTGVAAAPPSGVDPERLIADQRAFDDLATGLLAAYEDTFERRYSTVPARGVTQPGWITSQFLHGDWGHLIGNLLFLLLLGAALLEDAWGRWFFLAFYLAGGIAADVLQAALDPDSVIHTLGASGAISACLGAFAIRFAHRRVRVLAWFWVFFRTTFLVPAWAYAFLGFGADLLNLAAAGMGSGIAYAAHVGGFLFGVAVALALRATGLETRIAPAGALPWARSLGAARGADALALGDLARAEATFQGVLDGAPDDPEALLGLARVAAARSDVAGTTRHVERLLALRLAAGDREGARSLLAELVHAIDVRLVHPAIAYRAAASLRPVDRELAERLEPVALSAGGLVGLKARLFDAERLRTRDPAAARRQAEAIREAPEAPIALRDRAARLVKALDADGAPTPAASPGSAPPDAGGLELDHQGWVPEEAPSPTPAGTPRAPDVDAPAPVAGQVSQVPHDGPGALAARCARHPLVRAGWHCGDCREDLCPDCAYQVPAGTAELAACCACDGLARPLRVHRRHLVPLLRRARAAFLVLLRPDAAVALAAVAGFLWLLAQLGPLGELLAGASAFAMFLHELRAAGQGVEHVGLWEFTDFFDDLVFPAVRGLVATAILWIPAVTYLAIRSDGPEPLGALLSDPPMALCYAAGWLYAPAALLLAASGRGLLQVMAPDLVVRAAFRLGWDYVVAAACVAGLILAEAGVLRVAGAVAGTGVPFLSGWAAVLLCAYLPAVAARILGILLHVRGDDLGVGSPEQYLDPVLPGALPRGQRRVLPGA